MIIEYARILAWPLAVVVASANLRRAIACIALALIEKREDAA